MPRTMILLLALAPIAVAQAPDPIKARLDKARVEYQSAEDAMNKESLKRFDEADKMATDAGDTRRVTLIEEERDRFLKGESWDFQTIDAKDLKARHEANRKAMRAAYKDASICYTRDRQRALAKAVQAEFDEYEQAQAAFTEMAANKPYDMLQAGSKWVGTRILTDGNAAPYELLIDSRVGDGFFGRTIGNRKNINQIQGRIAGGRIEWESIRTLEGINRGQPHIGTIKDDVLSLKFKGLGPGDRMFEGTTQLRLMK